MIYTLTWDGVVQNLLIGTSPDVDVAKAFIDSARADKGYVVRNAEDLEVLSGPTLAVLHNKLYDLAYPDADNSESHVARFATKGDGQRRVFALLEDKFKTAPEVAAPSTGDTAATPNDSGNSAGTNEEGDDMASKAKKKTAKKTKTPKTPREKKPAKEKIGVDDFGLRKGSKNSQAASMFARQNGATMAAVKEKLEDTFYGMLNKLSAAGHKVKKDGKTIFLTAK